MDGYPGTNADACPCGCTFALANDNPDTTRDPTRAGNLA